MSLKNSKAKGSRNERRTMALLETAGYRCAKSGGSLGAWDVIGIGSTDFVVVQVKSNAWPGSAEMETLKGFAVPSNTKRLVHRWRDRKQKPDVREL
jgi:Holliday junction resolvase